MDGFAGDCALIDDFVSKMVQVWYTLQKYQFISSYKHISHTLEDSSVRNMLVKAVCLTNASLAVHSNVIERITNIS